MEMLVLNDLLPKSQQEEYYTIAGDEHAGLAFDKKYVIFEYYCVNSRCDCKHLVAEIREINPNNEANEKTAAIIDYNWSSHHTNYTPTLHDESPEERVTLNLLAIYKKLILQKEYLDRIKRQYTKIRTLALQPKVEPQIQ